MTIFACSSKPQYSPTLFAGSEKMRMKTTCSCGRACVHSYVVNFVTNRRLPSSSLSLGVRSDTNGDSDLTLLLPPLLLFKHQGRWSLFYIPRRYYLYSLFPVSTRVELPRYSVVSQDVAKGFLAMQCSPCELVDAIES